jgi:hypothetical protein
MLVKCISVKAQQAYQICLGFKPIENRSWTTNYRGKLYIHSCGDYQYPELDLAQFPRSIWKQIQKDFKDDTRTDKNLWLMHDKYVKVIEKFYGDDYQQDIDKLDYCFIQNKSIIGTVDLVDVIKDSQSEWSDKNCYHWVLENPILFEKPIKNINGKLRLFDINI